MCGGLKRLEIPNRHPWNYYQDMNTSTGEEDWIIEGTTLSPSLSGGRGGREERERERQGERVKNERQYSHTQTGTRSSR